MHLLNQGQDIERVVKSSARVSGQNRLGLTGRQALAAMMRAYEAWRQDGLLPASYEVVYGVLEKR